MATVTKLTGQKDLIIVLRRMTNKALRDMREDTQETDFTDNESAFHFSHREIAKELNGCPKNVAETILDSDLDYSHRGSETMVWLPDLTERLEAFAQQ